ncbi:hypothetical protein AB6A40_008561 [Gnathostoma spinigerum]|uniref:GlcNAc-PI synthesis protein n=1 Tax=Gnathostoma spinigerum TaxID=75299 RepID=A0ABD6ERT3_9BILA
MFTDLEEVYYLPFLVAYNGCSLGSIMGSLYWFRKIFIRERIQLVHGHSTFSTLAHEAMFHAWCLGLHTVFTDHSLFGFADASAILTNHLVLHYSLTNVDQVICVSYTSKENTVLRGELPAHKVSVIPNAINTDAFVPDVDLFYHNPTTIVVLSRLVYRKGVDLLTGIIPFVCLEHPNVRFIIGGDGPKRVDLEEMRENYHLHNRVIMLGTIPHNQVRDVLVQGQIFLNTSLTEAFCMSIVEAASCGLHIVSTRVGGIPEVLPDAFITMEEPVPELLGFALSEAIRKYESGKLMPPDEKHFAVRKMYSWQDVARRTEVVYRKATQCRTYRWSEGITRYYDGIFGFGMLYICASLLNMLCCIILELFDPAEKIPECHDEPKINVRDG